MTKLETNGTTTARWTITVSALAILTGLVGCAGTTSARPHITVVRQHDQGGEIALHGPLVASHHAAEDAMIAHCQGRAEIVSVVRGDAPSIRSAQHTKIDALAIPSDAEHMHYVCVSRSRRALAGR